MAVAHGTNFNPTSQNTAVTTLSTASGSISGSDSNRALICFLAVNPSISGLSIALDPAGVNQALTRIVAANNSASTGRVEMWGLLNPSAVTSKVITATWTTGSKACIAGAYFKNVDQTAFATSFIHTTSNTGTGTAASIAITTASGSASVGQVCDNTTQTCSNPTPQTQIFLANVSYDGGSGYILSTGASDTHNWTYAGSIPWVMVGCEVVQVGGDGGRGLFQPPLLNGLGGSGSGFFVNPISRHRQPPIQEWMRRDRIFMPRGLNG